MKVKLLTDGCYSFGEKYIGQIFDATYTATPSGGYYELPIPSEVGDDGDCNWVYNSSEVEVIDG